MAKIQILKTEFNGSALPVTWANFTTGGGAFTFTASGIDMSLGNPATATGDADMSSATTYSLVDSYAAVNVVNINASAATSCFGIFRMQITNANMVWFRFQSGNMQAVKTVASVETQVATTTWDSSAHAWVRIRSDGRTTYWETSPDGLAPWTNFWNEANPITITALTALFGDISTGTDADPGSFKIRNFNVLPAGVRLNNSGLRPHPFSPGLAR